MAVLVAGASLIAAAASGNSGLRKGGVLKVAEAGPSVSLDPQVADTDTAWWLEYATAAKLFNYPDTAGYAGTLLQPEVAFNYRISRDGKTYSFTIRRGFRFSNGKPVTGKSFVYALDRLLNPRLASPAAQWGAGIADYIAKGDKLLIKLEKPDPTFLTKLAMPLFQATSTRLPRASQVRRIRNVRNMPTAGPYAFARAGATLTRIVRNPYWKPGPARHRPRNLVGLTLTWNGAAAAEADLREPGAEEVQDLARSFGVNKTRFWVEPNSCLGYAAFNNQAGLFASNPDMRKAVNFGLDRSDYAAQAGSYAASPWTHILPPGVPGSKGVKNPYPIHRHLETARSLAAGHFKDGVIRVVADTPRVRANLIDLGFAPENIVDATSERWDLWLNLAWCPDLADPYEFFRLLTDQDSPAYFPDSAWRKRIEATARLTGERRVKEFGKRDFATMVKAAPLLPLRTFNKLYLFSSRVDPHSLVYQGIYSDWSIPALALK